MKRMKKTVAACLAALMLAAGCSAQEEPAEQPEAAPDAQEEPAEETQPGTDSQGAGGETQAVELQVFAAASLTETLEAIAESYKEVAPEVTLVFNLDSSGTLLKQIQGGAQADVFISAAQTQMNTLEGEGGVAEGTRKDLLVNKVVLIVPEGSEKGIASFEDCATDKVELMAVGNSDVPVGQYTEEIFTSLGLWEGLQPKLSLGQNVKAVLSQVESGSVDCGIVYATDAAAAAGVTVVCEAPEGTHSPVVYPAAVLEVSAQKEAAQAFLDYLSSDAAVAIFEEAGFAMA